MICRPHIRAYVEHVFLPFKCLFIEVFIHQCFPGGANGKEPGFSPWVGKIP